MTIQDIINYAQTHYDDSKINPFYRPAFAAGFKAFNDLVIKAVLEKSTDAEFTEVHDGLND